MHSLQNIRTSVLVAAALLFAALAADASVTSSDQLEVSKRQSRNLAVEVVEVFQVYVGDSEPGLYFNFDFTPNEEVVDVEHYVDREEHPLGGFQRVVKQRPLDASGNVVDDVFLFGTHGGEFITHGVLYPAGTVTCDENGCNGVDANGNPQFPELVIGTWTCRGWIVGQGPTATEGAWTATTQIYSFTPDPDIDGDSEGFDFSKFDYGSEYGFRTITTDGFESPAASPAMSRAITGGTGRYAGARGVQRQSLMGFNATGGVVLAVDFRLMPFRPWF